MFGSKFKRNNISATLCRHRVALEEIAGSSGNSGGKALPLETYDVITEKRIQICAGFAAVMVGCHFVVVDSENGL